MLAWRIDGVGIPGALWTIAIWCDTLRNAQDGEARRRHGTRALSHQQVVGCEKPIIIIAGAYAGFESVQSLR